jgi:hypothetical protein
MCFLGSHQCCGSVFISTGYGSGFVFFFHQEKIVSKTLIPTGTVLLLLYEIAGKSNKQKNFKKKNLFFVAILKVTEESSRSRIRIR